MRKKSTFYAALTAVAVVALLCSILIPEVGKFTLFNEFFNIIVMSSMIIMLVKSLIVLIKSKKISIILLITAVVLIIGVVAGSKSIKTVKDLVSGPEWITISDCELERSTSRGIFSLNYYLKGEDSNGNSYRFYLSGKEYKALKGIDEVSALCYKDTGRIVELKR